VGGYELVALIFVNEVSDPLTSLVKQIDKQLETAPHDGNSAKLGVFIVFCNDNGSLNQQLKDLVARERLQHVVLCTTNAPPPRYRVANEAELTVAIYEDHAHVSANIPVRKGSLNGQKAEEIIRALARALPKK
jgi:hypothetical protein